LDAISEQSPDAVRAALAELLRREVLEISADPLSPQRGEYRFAQLLLRQVAYDTLSRRDRKARHLAVAAHLRATFADDGEEVSDAIARHYRDALTAAPDDPDAAEIRAQAIRMGIRAADRASRAGAPVTASAIYAAAAELAEVAGTGSADEAAGWWEKAANAAHTADNHDGCLTYANRAITQYTAAGRERAAARVAALAGMSLSWSGQLTLARERILAALAVLSPEPDVDTVTALGFLSGVEVTAGTLEAQLRTAEALELGQALDVGDAKLSGLFAARGIAHAIADRSAQAAASLEYAARLAARAGDGEAEGRALMNLSDVLAPMDPRAAAEAARAGADRARQVGARRLLAFSIANLAEALLTTGDWDEAAAVLTSAQDRDGLEDGNMTQIALAKLLALRGDDEAIRHLLATGFERFRTSEDPQDQSSVSLIEAFLADSMADQATALDRAQNVVAYERQLGIRAETVRWGWALAARNAQSLGDDAALQNLLGLLDSHPVGKLPLVLRAERDLARAGLAAGDRDEDAAALFDRAVAAFRRIPALFHLAHALLDQAEFLGRAGDPAGAELAVTEAAQIAERLRAKPLARRAAAARARAAVRS